MSRSRTKARHCVVQALYQWQMTGNDVNEIYEQFVSERNMAKVNVAYFKEMLQGVTTHLGDIDAYLLECMDRSIGEVDDVERAVLRMGCYELLFKLDVPYRVAINEALEAAKLFGAEQGYKFVNGVMDKLAQKLRPIEVGKSAS